MATLSANFSKKRGRLASVSLTRSKKLPPMVM
jgi:hypothetical protein